MSTSFPGTAADLTDDFVLRKCDYFITTQLWPLRAEMNPRLWLANFKDYEARYARYLLNAVIYLSAAVTERLLISTIQHLSTVLCPPYDDPAKARERWTQFAETAHIVLVSGERPRPTDSGYMFTRMARDVLNVPEDRIHDGAEAIAILLASPEAPVIFVDDFVGSGNQFRDTWNRPFPMGGSSTTFADLATRHTGPFFYCPLVATEHGMTQLGHVAPAVKVMPGYFLPERYSIFHPDSLTWPDDLKAGVSDFVWEASQRAGIPDTNGGENDWRGFHKLGLTLAFAHSVPDATIPLLWWNSETWNPLKSRPQTA